MNEKSSHYNAGERLKESLSATLDGQANELELRRVLDRIDQDIDLRAKASRYQLVGNVIKGESSRFSDIDLSAGIMSTIEQSEFDSDLEDAKKSQESARERGGIISFNSIKRFWPSLGMMAITASVAFFMVASLDSINNAQDTENIAMNESAPLSQPIQLGHGASNGLGAYGIRAGYSSRQHDSITPEQLAYAQNIADRSTQERFRAYALQHAELSAINHGQGMLSFARLTSFDAQ